MITAPASPLLTDLHQFTLLQAYLDRGMDDIAVFEFFVRKLPSGRQFLMAAGLESVLEWLPRIRFEAAELRFLEQSGRFNDRFLDYLKNFQFSGDVHAMLEGQVFFADEPILRITAPITQAQLIETRLINLLHYQTLAASEAARVVLAAPDKLLVDFGLRRAHGAEAGMLAARAAWLAGFHGSSNVAAEYQYGIPCYGAMDHAFVQAQADALLAFEHSARPQPADTMLLIDTYDTELDCAYHLQEYAGHARRKRAEGKAAWPGRKQVYRAYDQEGRMLRDTLTLENGSAEGEALIAPVMSQGRRVGAPPTLTQSRHFAARELARLPVALRAVQAAAPYSVTVAAPVRELARVIDARRA